MKRIWKRISALALAAVLLCGASPAAGIGGALTLRASAATVSGSCGESVSWSLDTDAGVLSITGTGAMEDYDYYSNPTPWSSNGSSVRTVVIGDGVTSIGNYAFRNCTSLTSVTIPDSVTSIGDWAFAWCESLASVTIGNSVTSIGFEAFAYCTSLTSVTIGNSVTSIGEWAFMECTSLTAIYVDARNPVYSSDASGVLYDKEKTVLIQYPAGNARTTFVIPDSVTSIGGGAFGECTSLASVTIPDSVTSIGDYAFAICTSLARVTIPDSVTSIGNSAFRYCTSLESVTIPDSVTRIGDRAFEECMSLTGVTIPDSMTSIGDETFEYCTSLENVTIGNSVTSIGEWAFVDCTSLTAIHVDAQNPAYCSDASGVLYDKEKTVLIQYPAGNARTMFAIPDSVTSIGNYAFLYCTSLASVTIPDSVTSIGGGAFAWCESLESVTIPDGVTSIGDGVFGYCKSLMAIHVDTRNPMYCSDASDVLYDKEKTVLIQYPAGNTRTTFAIPDSVTSIGDYAFHNCTSLASVTIPDSVKSIGDSAFYSCKNLTSVTIGNSVTSIGDDAFAWCESLASVSIPNSVTSIGNFAFYSCKSLTSVTIRNSVTSIGNLAFYGCTSLKTVCYSGTSRENISIEGGNDNLLDAEWYYHRHDAQTETTTVNAVTPTCTREGYSGDVYYAPCGVLKQTGEILPALGHDFGAWTLSQAPTADAEGKETRACVRCGAEETRSVPKLISAISIRNYAASTETYAYRSTITFFADVKNPVLGAQIRWYVDGREYSANDSCTVTEADHSFTIQAKYVRGNDVLAESEIEKVNVNTGFFAKIIAFFRALFGRLPKVVQAYLGVETREKQADRPAAG